MKNNGSNAAWRLSTIRLCSMEFPISSQQITDQTSPAIFSTISAASLVSKSSRKQLITCNPTVKPSSTAKQKLHNCANRWMTTTRAGTYSSSRLHTHITDRWRDLQELLHSTYHLLVNLWIHFIESSNSLETWCVSTNILTATLPTYPTIPVTHAYENW